MKKYFIFLLSQLFLLTTSVAQYVEFPLDQRVGNSDLIVEGKVVEQFTYKKDDLIYTANQLEICEIIYERNRSTSCSNVFVITYGGEHEGEFNTWSHMLSLGEGMNGLFFLKSNSSISPKNVTGDSCFYEVYGQEQGFVAYAKDDNWDFSGISLFESINDVDGYIGQINTLTSQTSVTQSCLLEEKDGIVLKVDTAILNQETLTFNTSFKGQWSKEYNLERVKVKIQFSSATNLNNYNFAVAAMTSSLQNNYNVSWSQPSNTTAELIVSKNVSTTIYAQLGDDFSDFLEISFNSSLLSVGITSVEVIETSYKDGSAIIGFQEVEVYYNRIIRQYFAPPTITSFEPAEVCAGIKADMSSGGPVIAGYVIIKGNNFGNIPLASIPDSIPDKYRVEFRREKSDTSHAFKISPLPEDYDYWTNTEIKVRVPTVGWLVDNSTVLSGGPMAAIAVTGRISVVTPEGSTHTDTNLLKVRFAHLNTKSLSSSTQSLPNKLIDRSGNGGYYFVFDSTFDSIYPPSPMSAKQDIIDVLCEWNSVTEAKLEVVDTCPAGSLCFKITYKFLPSSPGTLTLARGQSNAVQTNCPNESVVNFMELIYNNEVTDWKPLSAASPGDPYVIKPAAYHEVGHLLQMGHVYNKDS